MVRLSDDQFFTWSAMYGAKRGLSEFLDVVIKEAKDHPGAMPVVTLESWERVLTNGEKRWVPRLRVIDWQPFNEGASLPADPRNLERIKKKLQSIKEELEPSANSSGSKSKPSSRSDMDDLEDSIPF
jgi:hypothetical protein